jgi:hypothetical protein
MYEYNNRLVPCQRSRDPHGLKGKWNRRRRSRGPPYILCPVCAHSKDTYYHLPPEVISGALVHQVARFLPHTIPFCPVFLILGPFLFRRLPSMHLFLCSPASPPLQVLFTCVRCQLPACAGPRFSHHRDLRATAGACCRLRRSLRQIPSPAWHGTPPRTCPDCIPFALPS